MKMSKEKTLTGQNGDEPSTHGSGEQTAVDSPSMDTSESTSHGKSDEEADPEERSRS